MPDYERKERIVTVLGSTAVGKSALSLMFVENRFIEFYEPTINKSYIKNEFRLNGREYEIRVNDTFGLDQYSNIPENYFNSHGYVLVYSITNPQSLETVRDIYNSLCNDLGRKPNVIVVGNKSDLNGQRKVQYEEGKQLAEPWGATFLEISAKHPNNVVDVFETLLTQIDPPEIVTSNKEAKRESESQTAKSQSKLSQFWDMFKFKRASNI